MNDLPQPRFLFFDSPSDTEDEAALSACFCGCGCCCWPDVGVVDVAAGALAVAVVGAGAAEEATGTIVGVVDSERPDDGIGGVCEDALPCGLSDFTTCGHDPMLLLLS